MGRLKLNFLDDFHSPKSLNPVEQVLHDFGQEIYDYSKGYFNYVVATSSEYDEIKDASLYIIVPEIGYDYRILNIEYINVDTVQTRFYTLKTNQTESDEISIAKGWNKVYDRISELLSTPLANTTFRFLVDQVNIKRENKDE